MRHSLEPEYRKYVKGYGVLSFERNFRDKYGKKLVDSATKSGLKNVVKKQVKILLELLQKGY